MHIIIIQINHLLLHLLHPLTNSHTQQQQQQLNTSHTHSNEFTDNMCFGASDAGIGM